MKIIPNIFCPTKDMALGSIISINLLAQLARKTFGPGDSSVGLFCHSVNYSSERVLSEELCAIVQIKCQKKQVSYSSAILSLIICLPEINPPADIRLCESIFSVALHRAIAQ
jgi:hypothetical protein